MNWNFAYICQSCASGSSCWLIYPTTHRSIQLQSHLHLRYHCSWTALESLQSSWKYDDVPDAVSQTFRGQNRSNVYWHVLQCTLCRLEGSTKDEINVPIALSAFRDGGRKYARVASFQVAVNRQKLGIEMKRPDRTRDISWPVLWKCNRNLR